MRYKSSVFLLLLLHGCATPIMFGIGATSIVVNETTGKSVTDHAVSTAKEKDCRLWRYFKGEQVCQEVEITARPAAPRKITDSNEAITTYEEILARRVK